MNVASYWNTPGVRILTILIGIVIIWIGIEATKPLGYILEAVGLVFILAGVININRVMRRQNPE